jgi:hypothetical protein
MQLFTCYDKKVKVRCYDSLTLDRRKLEICGPWLGVLFVDISRVDSTTKQSVPQSVQHDCDIADMPAVSWRFAAVMNRCTRKVKLLHFRFSWRWPWKLPSCGMWCGSTVPTFRNVVLKMNALYFSRILYSCYRRYVPKKTVMFVVPKWKITSSVTRFVAVIHHRIKVFPAIDVLPISTTYSPTPL